MHGFYDLEIIKRSYTVDCTLQKVCKIIKKQIEEWASIEFSNKKEILCSSSSILFVSWEVVFSSGICLPTV